jgi:hypothetical protein
MKETIMTKTNKLVLAAFLMASTSPMAFAQTPAPGTDAPIGTDPVPLPGDDPLGTEPAPLPGVDAPIGTEPTPLPGADAPVGGDTMPGTGMTPDMSDQDFENRELVTSLSLPTSVGIDWELEFSNLTEDAQVNFAYLSDLRDADDAAAPVLDQAMTDLEADQEGLRSAIENNETVLTALEDEGYSVEDVVAAVVRPEAEDEVTLVIDAEAGMDGEDDLGVDFDADAEGEADL